MGFYKDYAPPPLKPMPPKPRRRSLRACTCTSGSCTAHPLIVTPERQPRSRMKRPDGFPRQCSKCLSWKHHEHEFYWLPKAGRWASWCKECQRDKTKARTVRLRQAMLDAYGRACACCGESEERFLELDHVKNDGKAHRKRVGSLTVYSALEAAGWPKDGLRVLCMNCNHGRHLNGGECPHETRKRCAFGITQEMLGEDPYPLRKRA